MALRLSQLFIDI